MTYFKEIILTITGLSKISEVEHLGHLSVPKQLGHIELMRGIGSIKYSKSKTISANKSIRGFIVFDSTLD